MRLTSPVAEPEVNLKDEATLTCMSQTAGQEHPLSSERWWCSAVTPWGLGLQKPQPWRGGEGEDPADEGNGWSMGPGAEGSTQTGSYFACTVETVIQGLYSTQCAHMCTHTHTHALMFTCTYQQSGLAKPCLRSRPWGLPLWSSGEESACQDREPGFDPWSGKIPHASEQLSPGVMTTEAHVR